MLHAKTALFAELAIQWFGHLQSAVRDDRGNQNSRTEFRGQEPIQNNPKRRMKSGKGAPSRYLQHISFLPTSLLQFARFCTSHRHYLDTKSIGSRTKLVRRNREKAKISLIIVVFRVERHRMRSNVHFLSIFGWHIVKGGSLECHLMWSSLRRIGGPIQTYYSFSVILQHLRN